MGLAPSKVRALRTGAASSTPVRAGGRCGTTAVALTYGEEKDPAFAVRHRQLECWKQIWFDLDRDMRIRVRRLWTKQMRKLNEQPRWNGVIGPMSATIASLYDVGWKPIAPDRWISPAGDRWDLLGPGGSNFFKQEFLQSVMQKTWEQAASIGMGRDCKRVSTSQWHGNMASCCCGSRITKQRVC